MIHLRLLGTPNVERDGKPLPPFKSRKVLALLAYLALNPGAHPRSRLAGLLWSDSSEKKALDNLRFALWNLNETLGVNTFTADRISVAWQPNARVSLDTDEFRAAIRVAESSLNPLTPAGLGALEIIAELYRGDLLAGFDLPQDVLFNEWLQQQRACLRELALDALYRLAHHHSARNRLTPAIAVTRRLLTMDPWREEAHRALMGLLAHSGQRRAALAQYQICRRILTDELGVAPAHETTALFERIRAADTMPRHNLPAQLTPFVGRADELAEITALLDDPACRLLNLVGLGGIGKTRLAIQAATLCFDRFLNGICFVPLASVNSLDQLAFAIAHQLHFDLSASDHLPPLQNYLRTKELLVVLDNFEQLRAGATWLVEMLQHAPDVKILATSRERLNVQAEWVYEIRGLASADAAQLFTQSARRARARFVLNDSDTHAVTRICDLLDGMPLGIELAATWVHKTGCGSIVRALERNLDALSTTMPDMPERHHSLRATFDGSWDLLDAEEQRVFRQLSVFRGGLREAAADQIAGSSLAGLLALVGKSLLKHTRDGRYEMLETVRQYAEGKLSASIPETIATRDAHAAYFADFLAQRETSVRRGNHETLAQIAEDIENIRAGWEWAVKRRHLALIDRALASIALFYETRNWSQEGAAMLARAAAQLEGERNATLGKILAWQGVFVMRLADYARARELLQTGLDIFRENSARDEMTFALNNLGTVAERLGEPAEAERLYKSSLALARETNDDWGVARALTNLGHVLHVQGDEMTARQSLEEALAIRRHLDDRPGIAKTLINLALTIREPGQQQQARQFYQESIAIFQELDNRLGVAI
ncbi:partial Putative HTH-type transcriptional regulator, partial [Anaerolineae bacterium]